MMSRAQWDPEMIWTRREHQGSEGEQTDELRKGEVKSCEHRDINGVP